MKINHEKESRLGRTVAFCALAIVLVPISVQAERSEDGIGLNEYLKQVKANHPFFIQQALNGDIERAQQHRFLGDEDWVIKVNPSYQHTERSTGSAFVAEEQDNLSFNAGVERQFWSNGSRVSIDYDYYHSDQHFSPPSGAFDEQGSGLNVTYTIPLMKNKGGVLSRLDYELQAYSVDLSEINSTESMEGFLEQQGLMFLDWVFITEQRRIAKNRLALAEEELARTKKKRRSRLVAEVDVLRAQDAVINAMQNLASIKSQWRAVQAELATHSANPALYQMAPQLDLYTLKTLPPLEQALSRVRDNARQLQSIDIQVAQMDRLKSGFGNQLEPELDLVVGGGLRSEADNFSGSTKFDQPQYMIGVNFRYPLGQRSARADVNKTRLQRQQLKEAKNNLLWQLEAQLRNLVVQLIELEKVIDLNKEQIVVARKRTQEELKRHNQGRSELSFVIQSRDNEQNAQLTYAANAANYQKLWLRYEALTDALLADADKTEQESRS
ncbi:MAG: TolC family protein [Gammaproteobacteria bacterium]